MSIGARAKPQLHRFSLGRFAARTREISPRETYRPSRPSHPADRSPTCSSSRMTTPQDTSAECIAPDPPPWFFLVFSLPVAVSATRTWAHVYTSSRFFIPLGHVYPREGNVRRKENVSPRCRQILSRSRRWRNGSYTMAEKRGTKYLICGRTKLAPSDEMYFSSRTRTRLLSRWTLPPEMENSVEESTPPKIFNYPANFLCYCDNCVILLLYSCDIKIYIIVL